MYLPQITTVNEAELMISVHFITFLVCVSSEAHIGIKNVVKLSKPMTEEEHPHMKFTNEFDDISAWKGTFEN